MNRLLAGFTLAVLSAFLIVSYGIGSLADASKGPQYVAQISPGVADIDVQFVGETPWLLLAEALPETDGGGHKGNEFMLRLVDWRKDNEVSSRILSAGPNEKPSCKLGIEPLKNDFVATLCGDVFTVDLPELRTGRQLLQENRYRLQAVSASPNGEILAVAHTIQDEKEGSFSREIILFDTSTWERKGTISIEWELNSSTSLSFSGNGEFLAVATSIVDTPLGGYRIRVFDTDTRELLSDFRRVSNPQEVGVWSPFLFAGPHWEFLASGGAKVGGDNRLKLWNWRTGQATRFIEDKDGIGSLLAVSADGRLVAASVSSVEADEEFGLPLFNRDFKIWDLETGGTVYQSPRYFLATHNKRHAHSPRASFVVQVAFSNPPNYFVVAGIEDVAIYDLR